MIQSRTSISLPVMGLRNFGVDQFIVGAWVKSASAVTHMIKKRQMVCPAGQTMSAADQFYSLAF